MAELVRAFFHIKPGICETYGQEISVFCGTVEPGKGGDVPYGFHAIIRSDTNIATDFLLPLLRNHEIKTLPVSYEVVEGGILRQCQRLNGCGQTCGRDVEPAWRI